MNNESDLGPGVCGTQSSTSCSTAVAAYLLLWTQMIGLVAKLKLESEKCITVSDRFEQQFSRESVPEGKRNKLQTGKSCTSVPTSKVVQKEHTNSAVLAAYEAIDVRLQEKCTGSTTKELAAASLLQKTTLDLIATWSALYGKESDNDLDSKRITVETCNDEPSDFVFESSEISSAPFVDIFEFLDPKTHSLESAWSRKQHLTTSPISVQAGEFLSRVLDSAAFNFGLDMLLEVRSKWRTQSKQCTPLRSSVGSLLIDTIPKQDVSWKYCNWTEAATARSEAKIRTLTREKKAKIEELNVQAKLRRNLQIQVNNHLRVFSAIEELATTPLHPQLGLAHSHKIVIPNPLVPCVIAEMLRGEKNYGPTIQASIDAVISLKSSERALLQHNMKLKMCIKRLMRLQETWQRKQIELERLENWYKHSELGCRTKRVRSSNLSWRAGTKSLSQIGAQDFGNEEYIIDTHKYVRQPFSSFSSAVPPRSLACDISLPSKRMQAASHDSYSTYRLPLSAAKSLDLNTKQLADLRKSRSLTISLADHKIASLLLQRRHDLNEEEERMEEDVIPYYKSSDDDSPKRRVPSKVKNKSAFAWQSLMKTIWPIGAKGRTSRHNKQLISRQNESTQHLPFNLCISHTGDADSITNSIGMAGDYMEDNLAQ